MRDSPAKPHTLNVPVGMIHSSWGGTSLYLWMRRDVMEADPASLLDDEGANLDPHRIWARMFMNEKPGGHGERAARSRIGDAADGVDDLLRRLLLGQVSLRPRAERAFPVQGLVVHRQDEHGQVGKLRLEFLQQLDPVAVPEGDVNNTEVGPGVADRARIDWQAAGLGGFGRLGRSRPRLGP